MTNVRSSDGAVHACDYDLIDQAIFVPLCRRSAGASDSRRFAPTRDQITCDVCRRAMLAITPRQRARVQRHFL